MASLKSLKFALKQKVNATVASPGRPLSDTEYSTGFNILVRGLGWMTYRDFIIPQLLRLLDPFLKSQSEFSVLEIGPGPNTVLEYLPSFIRNKITKYVAFEPNELFATALEESLCSISGMHCPLPSLENPPSIHHLPFSLHDGSTGVERFDVILFCHSLYGMDPKIQFIEQTLEMLVERPKYGIVVVFHRDGSLQLNGVESCRTASFPTGVVCVTDDDEDLDQFAPFIAGFVPQYFEEDKAIRAAWRKVCRNLGRRDEAHPNQLFFNNPNIMMAFTRHATALPELIAQVPLLKEDRGVKNREALANNPAAIVWPTEIHHIQQCVRWALKHHLGLTVTGGGHSSHCRWSNVVSVDMGAFDQVQVFHAGETGGPSPNSGPLVIAGAGCKTGDIVRKTMAAGLTVPLGSRPSVGAGLWLQGGIGHLARLYGLSCDAIVGIVMVSVGSGQLLCIGHVPNQCQPAGAICPENESDLLWAIKGAGTNFGIIVSVVFKAYPAAAHSVRKWMFPSTDRQDAISRMHDLNNRIAKVLPRTCSVDAYLYWEKGQLYLGVTLFEITTPGSVAETPTSLDVGRILGPDRDSKTVDGVGLFDAEMRMSDMHGGHGGKKTSSFKRCLFFEDIGQGNIIDKLVKAIDNRPTPFCYVHLLRGGGAVRDIPADATAFGCRDWDFACVITGIWTRDQDGTGLARSAMEWVYRVSRELLSMSNGVYSADLGPDPRDAELAIKAFGLTRPKLERLKAISDPSYVLAYACPLGKLQVRQKLIVLVTGESGAGKEYCARIWASTFSSCTGKNLRARTVSISDVTKKQYAAATGADITRLLHDRLYKEKHRPALTAFFHDQLKRRPQLLEEHFLDVVYHDDAGVLLITGMREEAPLASYSHLVPERRLIEVRVQASKPTRQARRGCSADSNEPTADDYSPSFTFANEQTGDEAAYKFARDYLFPFFDESRQQLADMVRPVPGFPRPGINFQHVLNIAQQPGGLKLVTSLLGDHLNRIDARMSAIVCSEASGFIFGTALAADLNIPLALIREAGKLPPPTISVPKPTSHISSATPSIPKQNRIEMERGLIPRGSSVMVVDDVLATGKTLCAVLQLLEKAGISKRDISVVAVAEFPVHHGRELLHKWRFGAVNIQSLLVFDGV